MLRDWTHKSRKSHSITVNKLRTPEHAVPKRDREKMFMGIPLSLWRILPTAHSLIPSHRPLIIFSGICVMYREKTCVWRTIYLPRKARSLLVDSHSRSKWRPRRGGKYGGSVEVTVPVRWCSDVLNIMFSLLAGAC